jgi:hypothetical protein
MNLKDFLDSKNIKYPELIVSDDLKTHTLVGLLNEYASIHSEKYLCYSKIIELIDESDDLKELEIKVNRFFKSY